MAFSAQQALSIEKQSYDKFSIKDRPIMHSQLEELAERAKMGFMYKETLYKTIEDKGYTSDNLTIHVYFTEIHEEWMRRIGASDQTNRGIKMQAHKIFNNGSALEAGV